MFDNILVATGESPWSRHAVDTACRLAAETRAALLIAHILDDDPRYQPQELDVDDPETRAQLEEAGNALLHSASVRAEKARVPHRTVLEWGGIPETIVRIARKEGCNLIIMGTRHLTGEKRLMTGRICNAVIATAPCPVLVVPLVQ
jgi:nucleotide-binding universal stress UspA family protein